MCAFGQPPTRRAVVRHRAGGRRYRCWPWPWPWRAAACQAYRLSLLLLVAGRGLVQPCWACAVPGGRGAWQGFGTLYIGLPCIAIIWLRAQAPGGLATLVWVLALVDCGRYRGLCGRPARSAGPKLAPRISPNKTWAGLAGRHCRGHGRGLRSRLSGWAAPRSGRWCWRAPCWRSWSRRAIWRNRASSAISASRTAAVSFPVMAASSTGSMGFWPWRWRSALAQSLGGGIAGMDAVKADLDSSQAPAAGDGAGLDRLGRLQHPRSARAQPRRAMSSRR